MSVPFFSRVCKNARCFPTLYKRLTLREAKRLSSIAKVLPSQCDVQSVILPEPERIRASILLDDPYQLVEYPENGVRTVYDALHYGLKVSGDGDCLGTLSEDKEEYKWIKYSELIRSSEYFGSSLIDYGLKPKNDTFVGIYSKNRKEYVMTTMGCTTYSMVPVPLYDTLGMESIPFIVNQAELPVIVCDTIERAQKLLNGKEKLPTLQLIIVMDEITPDLQSLGNSKGVDVLSFSESQTIGKAKKRNPVPPARDDLYTISYTSGTTGNPKGVMLTHKNIISFMTAVIINMGSAYSAGDSIISYLPSAHIYEIANQVIMIYKGGKIGFYAGDIKELFTDINVLKPSSLPLVPRLMNRLFTILTEDLHKRPVKRRFWNLALKKKEQQLKSGIIKNDTVWDKMFFKKLREDLGGNTGIIVTTSAPISPEVMKFFRLAAGCYVFEAYGQTEACCITQTLPYETEGGFVGPPLPCNHVKLVDVPEMGYFAENDTGEICARGANIFKGYFKNPEATAAAIDSEGWLHTGDIGKWLPNGTLAIIDRKKHFLKLSQGEYVAPEKVENVYTQCDSILQIYVDGISTEDYLVAVIVPEEATFIKWAKKHKFDTSDYNRLCSNEEARAALLKKLHRIGDANGLNSLEQVKNIFLLPDPMTVENGLLTPTLKLKRNAVRKHFSSLLEHLYKEGPLLQRYKGTNKDALSTLI